MRRMLGALAARMDAALVGQDAGEDGVGASGGDAPQGVRRRGVV
jgi:hypothetical protein